MENFRAIKINSKTMNKQKLLSKAFNTYKRTQIQVFFEKAKLMPKLTNNSSILENYELSSQLDTSKSFLQFSLSKNT